MKADVWKYLPISCEIVFENKDANLIIICIMLPSSKSTLAGFDSAAVPSVHRKDSRRKIQFGVNFDKTRPHDVTHKVFERVSPKPALWEVRAWRED